MSLIALALVVVKVLDDLATSGEQTALGGLHAVHHYFEHGTEGRSLLDKKTDVLAVKADHAGLFSGDFKTKVLDVEGSGAFGILRLNQNIAIERVCHEDSLAASEIGAGQLEWVVGTQSSTRYAGTASGHSSCLQGMPSLASFHRVSTRRVSGRWVWIHQVWAHRIGHRPACGRRRLCL